MYERSLPLHPASPEHLTPSVFFVPRHCYSEEDVLTSHTPR
jgi:hypothetical protein